MVGVPHHFTEIRPLMAIDPPTHDDDDEPLPIPCQRTRAQVLSEYRDTQRRRMHIRGEWDQHLRDIAVCRVNFLAAGVAVEALAAELTAMG